MQGTQLQASFVTSDNSPVFPFLEAWALFLHKAITMSVERRHIFQVSEAQIEDFPQKDFHDRLRVQFSHIQ